MKRIAALAVTALVVIAGSQLVSTVGATQNASAPKRLSILEGKVRKLQTQMNAAKANLACLKRFVPVSQYGDATAAPANGYVFTDDAGATAFLTSALDMTEQGQARQAYVSTVNPTCVGGAAKATLRFSQLRLASPSHHITRGEAFAAFTGASLRTNSQLRLASPSTHITRSEAFPAVTGAVSSLWTNCTKVHTRYPHGVGRLNARDHTRSGTPGVTTFKRSTRLYNTAMTYNRDLDRDRDGVACEKR